MRRIVLKDQAWLGEVPEAWDVVPLRFGLEERNERNGKQPVGEMLSVSGYTGVSVKEYDHESRRRSAEELENYRVVRPGQLVVNTMWLNHIGLGVSDDLGHVSPAYSVYSIRDRFSPEYVHYLLRSARYVERYKALLYGIRPNSLQIKSHDWGAIPLLAPPLETQNVIADFLDLETAKVDTLIEKKQRLLELLEEKRTALITGAVTRGLDPDVSMKDSGVEWIGEIPEHWEVRRLKTLANAFPSNVDKKKHEDEHPVRLCNYTDVYYGDRIEDAEEFMRATATQQEIKKFRLRRGDVLATKDSETADDIAVPAYVARDFDDVLCGYHLYLIRPGSGRVDGRYLYYSMLSERVSNQLGTLASGVTRYGLSVNDIRSAWFPMPPLEEQREIAKRLDEDADGNAEIASRAKQVISLLREYRTALISASVTGKIDVRTGNTGSMLGGG